MMMASCITSITSFTSFDDKWDGLATVGPVQEQHADREINQPSLCRASHKFDSQQTD